MESSMIVTETRGGWSVVACGVILQTFATHAQAWRWIDRQRGEPISDSENISDWVARKVSSAL
jgi:hypothetical protein